MKGIIWRRIWKDAQISLNKKTKQTGIAQHFLFDVNMMAFRGFFFQWPDTAGTSTGHTMDSANQKGTRQARAVIYGQAYV